MTRKLAGAHTTRFALPAANFVDAVEAAQLPCHVRTPKAEKVEKVEGVEKVEKPAGNENRLLYE
jgi:hypothetical protein